VSPACEAAADEATRPGDPVWSVGHAPGSVGGVRGLAGGVVGAGPAAGRVWRPQDFPTLRGGVSSVRISFVRRARLQAPEQFGWRDPL